MSEHTPTPWQADPDDREGYEWNIHIVDKSGINRICFMSNGPQTEANAALIVKAVNNHDVLVAELQRLFDLYGHQATADVLRDVGSPKQ